MKHCSGKKESEEQLYGQNKDYDDSIVVFLLGGAKSGSTTPATYLKCDSNKWDPNGQFMNGGKGSNFSNRAIGIINFERLSPNFIADTMNWFLNSILD